MSDWGEVQLCDYVHIKHGFAFKGEYFRDEPTSDYLVTPGNFLIGGGFKRDKFKFYAGPIPDEYVLSPGDLIVTMTDLSKQADTLGYSALVPDIRGKTLLHNQRIGLVEFLNEELDKVFAYFLLRTAAYRHHVISTASGSTVKHTSPSKIGSFRFRKPPLEAQIEISRILLQLEERIAVNGEINQTIEQIAHAIFKSWFIDFEPVKAKEHIRALGGNDEQTETAARAVIAGTVNLDVITTATDFRALDQQLTDALSEKLDHQTDEQREQLVTIASHFPDRLVESELGLIPDGWELTALSKMVELIGGGTPKKSEERYWGGEIPWFSVKDAPSDGQVFVLDTDLKITEEGLNESSTRLLDEGVTIVSARGTVGKLALVGVPMAMNQSCYGVAGAEGVPPYYNYFNLRQAVSKLKQNTHGAVFDTITRATFDTVTQVVPSSTILECFDETLSPLIQQIKENLWMSQVLDDIREALLPMLLSGDLKPGVDSGDG